MLAHVLVAGGASALVLDLVLAAGVVDFGADCAAATLRLLVFLPTQSYCASALRWRCACGCFRWSRKCSSDLLFGKFE